MASNKIMVPRSLDAATEKLGALGELLTATKWERAAILAAFVEVREENNAGGNRSEVNGLESAGEFARRGVVGLKSTATVARYVKAWMDEVGTRPQPGKSVALPTVEFPQNSVTGEAGGRGSQVESVVRSNSPAMAKVLGDPVIAKRVTKKMTVKDRAALAKAIMDVDDDAPVIEDDVPETVRRPREVLDPVWQARSDAADARKEQDRIKPPGGLRAISFMIQPMVNADSLSKLRGKLRDQLRDMTGIKWKSGETLDGAIESWAEVRAEAERVVMVIDAIQSTLVVGGIADSTDWDAALADLTMGGE